MDRNIQKTKNIIRQKPVLEYKIVSMRYMNRKKTIHRDEVMCYVVNIVKIHRASDCKHCNLFPGNIVSDCRVPVAFWVETGQPCGIPDNFCSITI